jgi:8-oxo-dGTP pyrophosphatase MutT (NUDIX family)
MPAAPARRVRPRDAASLVLIRHDGGTARVLMGQRHSGHVFMPDKFVFPGGRLDRADYRVRPLSDLRPEVAARVAHGTTESHARALGMAAIRETCEEAGLLVGRRVVRPPRSRSPVWRRFLSNGVVPSLDALEFIARAITPPGSPRRYDARFFMADARHIQGDLHEQMAGDGELLDLNWVPVDTAQQLDLPEITHAVIDEIAKRLAASTMERKRVPAPFFRFHGSRPVVELL